MLSLRHSENLFPSVCFSSVTIRTRYIGPDLEVRDDTSRKEQGDCASNALMTHSKRFLRSDQILHGGQDSEENDDASRCLRNMSLSEALHGRPNAL